MNNVADLMKQKTFEIDSNQDIVLSDPCYDLKDIINTQSPNLAHIFKAAKGTWTYSFDKSSCTLDIYLKDSTTPISFHEPIQDNFDDVVEFSVDSGQVGIFSMSSYRDNSLVLKTTFNNPKLQLLDDQPWYRYCCEVSSSSDKAGYIPYGFITSTRYGDGIYSAGVNYSKGTNEVNYIRIKTDTLFDDIFNDFSESAFDINDL